MLVSSGARLILFAALFGQFFYSGIRGQVSDGSVDSGSVDDDNHHEADARLDGDGYQLSEDWVDSFNEISSKRYAALTQETKRTYGVFLASRKHCGESCAEAAREVIKARKSLNELVQIGFFDDVDKALTRKVFPEADNSQDPKLVVYLERKIEESSAEKRNTERYHVSYEGNFKAQEIVDWLQSVLKDGAPIDQLSLDDASNWVSKNSAVPGAVVFFGTEESAGVLPLSFSRLARGLVPVAYITISDETRDGFNNILGSLKVGKHSSLAVYDGEKWIQMPTVGKSLDDIVKMVSDVSEVPQDRFFAFDEADLPYGQGLMTKMDELNNAVLQRTTPTVVAVRVLDKKFLGSTPAGWNKLFSKRHGVNFWLVFCDKESLGASQPTEPELCTSILSTEVKEDAEKQKKWLFFVYEWMETSDTSESRPPPKMVNTLDEASSVAISSIPKATIILKNREDFGQQLTYSHAFKKFPLLVLGRTKEVPPLISAIAAAFREFVLVMYWGNPPRQEVEQFAAKELHRLPSIGGVLIRDFSLTGGESKFAVVPYEKMRYGKVSFVSVLRFVLDVAIEPFPDEVRSWMKTNSASFGVLVKESSTNENTVSENENTITTAFFDNVEEPVRFLASSSDFGDYCPKSEKMLVCVVGFFDGNPLGVQKYKEHTSVFESARKEILENHKFGRRVRFLGIDASCQTEFSKSFGVDQTSLPAVVAFLPGKEVSFRMLASYTSNSIQTFLSSIIQHGKGKAQLSHTGKKLELEDIDCETLPDRMIPEDEEELSDDFLAELREEEEREARQREEELKRELEKLKNSERQKKVKKTIKRKPKAKKKVTEEKDEL